MEVSPTITKISIALVKAQSEMGNAIKDSKNPFFKSKYADLNSVREACLPVLLKNGISVLQPTVFKENKNFIQTILLHESGEFISGFTEIIYSKKDDAQSQGSGITYARRYGLQSIVNIGADDDDGNLASSNNPNESKTTSLVEEVSAAKKILDRAINNDSLINLFNSLSDKMKSHELIISYAKNLKVNFNGR